MCLNSQRLLRFLFHFRKVSVLVPLPDQNQKPDPDHIEQINSVPTSFTVSICLEDLISLYLYLYVRVTDPDSPSK